MRTLVGFVIALVGGGVGWLAWDVVPDARDDWTLVHCSSARWSPWTPPASARWSPVGVLGWARS